MYSILIYAIWFRSTDYISIGSTPTPLQYEVHFHYASKYTTLLILRNQRIRLSANSHCYQQRQDCNVYVKALEIISTRPQPSSTLMKADGRIALCWVGAAGCRLKMNQNPIARTSERCSGVTWAHLFQTWLIFLVSLVHCVLWWSNWPEPTSQQFLLVTHFSDVHISIDYWFVVFLYLNLSNASFLSW
jgi:hypothetical protein